MRTVTTGTQNVLAGRLIPAALVLLPLACWPAGSRPFSAPKLWLIGGLDVLVVVRHLSRARQSLVLPSWPWLAWIAAVSLSAVAAPVASPEAVLLLVVPLPLLVVDLDVRWALSAGSAVESAIVLLQFFNHDPLGWFGWQPEAFASPRMRVYGTLGNPDFVAAWLLTALPLAAAIRRRTIRVGLVILELAAVFCTGSRALLIALPVALAVCAITEKRLNKWWALAVPLVVATIWLSPARSLGATVKGRLHLAQVTAAHLREVPLTGCGPGAFELKFAEWQTAWVREHPQDRRYAGPVDHAHNDYLEFFVEYGPLGLAAFLVLCGSLLWPASGPRLPGVLPALAALLAVACIDFPLHRPAAWALFVVLTSTTRRSAP